MQIYHLDVCLDNVTVFSTGLYSTPEAALAEFKDQREEILARLYYSNDFDQEWDETTEDLDDPQTVLNKKALALFDSWVAFFETFQPDEEKAVESIQNEDRDIEVFFLSQKVLDEYQKRPPRRVTSLNSGVSWI